MIKFNLVCGNVFESNCDYIGVTTNSIVKRNGELVMGAGVALEAKTINPELPKLFGDWILRKNIVGGFYGIIPPLDGKHFAIQTKRHYKDKSNIMDVRISIETLKDVAEKRPNKTFAIAFPAINNGGLKEEDVIPHLNILPENVYVYKL